MTEHRPDSYEIARRVRFLLDDNATLVKAALEYCSKDGTGLDAIDAILEIRRLMTEILREEY